MTTLATAVAANIEHEVSEELAAGVFEDATAFAAHVWGDLTPNAAQCRLRAMRSGERLTLANITALARGLVVDCDDLTSTETAAARAALETRT